MLKYFLLETFIVFDCFLLPQLSHNYGQIKITTNQPKSPHKTLPPYGITLRKFYSLPSDIKEYIFPISAASVTFKMKS